MSDTTRDNIEAHINNLETYVNAVKVLLEKHSKGNAILEEARQQWTDTHPAWYKALYILCRDVSKDNPKSPTIPLQKA